jgi:K+/H+ antiporter YhaU regulatory subunit KhtT|tara:strand:- start:403 stop:621 length:219 start_codon:yes stop_codon:yes gene_type:complete
MTDKDKLENSDKKYAELHVLFESEKEMNKVLKKHIENLNFQIETQSKLLDKFCKTIGDLRFKVKTFINDKLL